MEKKEDFKSIDDAGDLTVTEYGILGKNKKFFSSKRKYLDAMIDIINGQSKISIRDLDWFVANYSKKKNTFYKTRSDGKESIFYVNIEYKRQLAAFSKAHFDPFCRKRKIIYNYVDTNGANKIRFKTSIGQLNFFEWAIRNKIIKYVEIHLAEIEKDMREITKKNKERKKQSTSAKSTEESDSDSSDKSRITSIDNDVCSSDNIVILGSNSSTKVSDKKNTSGSESRLRRQQLSKSVYDIGIKKSTHSVRLDFD